MDQLTRHDAPTVTVRRGLVEPSSAAARRGNQFGNAAANLSRTFPTRTAAEGSLVCLAGAASVKVRSVKQATKSAMVRPFGMSL
jgi:hypothetical protein